MKYLFGMAMIVFVGMVGFRVGGQLSADALGMAVGAALAIMGMITVTLMLLSSERRSEGHREPQERRPQPPKIIEQPPAPQITNNYITHNHLHVHQAPNQVRERRWEIEERHR